MTLEEAIKKKDEFIRKCTDGVSIVSTYARKAVERHLLDMEKSKDKDFGFYFDVDAAERVLTVFTHFKFAQGKWSKKPFELHDWQAFILWCAYGWKRKDNGWRKYSKIYIKVARKNGKTEFMAAIGMYGQHFDEYEKDRQVFWFATKRDQAAIGFKKQKAMAGLLMQDSPLFATKARILQYRISGRDDLGFTTYLGKDSKAEDGHDPFYGLCDEYHAHPNNEMVGVIESGMGARESPMTWMITTAGTNSEGPCARFEKTCKQILDGVIHSDEILPLIFDLDENDDENDPENWPKANPSIGASVTIDYLKREHSKSLTEGVESRNNFYTKNLNKWLKTSQGWMSDADWMAGIEIIEEDELTGSLCFGGLDLASVSDITTLVYEFPSVDDDGVTKSIMRAWVPEDTAHKRYRLDGVPYLDWIEQGILTATPGNVTDYNFIKKQILDDCEKFNVHSIAYDRYNASQLVIDLQDEGIKMTPFSQRATVISAPIKDMERLRLTQKYNHGGNPMLRWMCSNVAVKISAEGDIKFDKDKSSDKIDGMVSAAMAHGERMDNQEYINSLNRPIFLSL